MFCVLVREHKVRVYVAIVLTGVMNGLWGVYVFLNKEGLLSVEGRK